jgi:hypothetical protein
VLVSWVLERSSDGLYLLVLSTVLQQRFLNHFISSDNYHRSQGVNKKISITRTLLYT